MHEAPKCFVAYPSALPGKGDAIEAAIEQIAASGLLEITGWKSLSIEGQLIVGTITTAIENSDILMADVTGLNPNVLFEIGYGIARGKRLWLLFNPKVKDAKLQFDRFQILSTVGYVSYSNSRDISGRVYALPPRPYAVGEPTLLESLLAGPSSPLPDNTLLYVKPSIATESVVRIARRVSSAPIPHVIDDPDEVRTQPLSWYAEKVHSAENIVCHFLSDEYGDDAQLSNAKAAFVAGLAAGLDKNVLMLAHDPYVSPIDYRDMLRTHTNAQGAEAIYQAWLSDLLVADQKISERRQKHAETSRVHKNLLDLNIGDPVAEFEPEDLLNYFVETSAYSEAVKSQHSIFVGRKGTGKTATLLKVVDYLQADPRNHVCIIKPVDYELEGLVALMRTQLNASEKGFLVESFWKALVYTELARSLHDSILSRPDYYQPTEAEARLLEFIKANNELIMPEFSMRLENLVDRLLVISTEGDGQESVKQRISEQLHKLFIGRLRDLMVATLDKINSISILVDNLDKSWTPRTNIQLASELLFGLLSVSLRIAEDLRRASHTKKAVDVRMTIFIRSDIYAAVSSFAREADKLPIRRIEWGDPELLIRVIERRFLAADNKLADRDQMWAKYFTRSVRGIPTQQFLINAVFPRPRDLVYLVRASLQHAVNRGHTLVEEKDVISALQQYSSFAFDSLLAEGAPQFRQLQDFMLQLLGGPPIISIDMVREALETAELPFIDAHFVVDLLEELSFFGFETGIGSFEFCYDKEQKTKLSILAKKIEKKTGLRRMRVHSAFHAYLELQPEDDQFAISFS